MAWSLGGSVKDFGDVEAGGAVGEQAHTGYGEQDFDARVLLDLGKSRLLALALQGVVIDDAWRTHRTVFGRSFAGTTVGNEQRRVLDQQSGLAYLLYEDVGGGRFWDQLRAQISFQNQEEKRDRVRSDLRRDVQGFALSTWGVTLRFEKALAHSTWNWGVESYQDSVDSYRFDFDALGGASRVRIPARRRPRCVSPSIA
jgi:hemoglobin/transferrin/lactoferrin receptor protein